MKKIYYTLLLVFFIGIYGSIYAQTIALEGIYQGKDLYVKNPFSDSGVGFCVYEVYVNGDITRDETNSSAFAIDFNILGIKVGEPIQVRINHKKGCTPIVLNPEAIKPHSTFDVGAIGVKNNVLSWTTTGESGSLPFIVEQFRWNKWVKAGEVKGEGTAEEHTYKFKLTPYSGENKVRVKQIDYSDKPRYSEAVTYNPNVAKVSFEPKKVSDNIVFSHATKYEIFDIYGELVETGYDNTIDVSNLKEGEYYLNYDSSFGETFRKK